MIVKSVLLITYFALFASSVSLKGTFTAMQTFTLPPFAGTNDQVINTTKIYKAAYFTNDGNQSYCLHARDFYSDISQNGPSYAHLADQDDFGSVWRFEEVNGIYYIYLKVEDKEYCAVPNYDTRTVEFTEDKQCWTWKIDWLDNGYTIGTWDYQSVYLYLTPFDIQGRAQDGAPQPLFLEEEQKGKWGLTPIGDYTGERVPFNVPDGKLFKLTNEQGRYLTLIDEIESDHFELEQHRGFVGVFEKPNQTFVFEPVDGGYVISLGVDNLDDGLEWKGYCLTFDTSSKSLYFTDSDNSCLIWDISSNHNGKTIYIGTKRDSGNFQFLRSGELDAYVRNENTSYLYLWDGPEDARWNLMEDNYACDPLNVVVDTSKWYKIVSTNEGQEGRNLQAHQSPEDLVVPKQIQKLILHIPWNVSANSMWRFVKASVGYQIRLAKDYNTQFDFTIQDWCMGGDGKGGATVKLPSLNQCHEFEIRRPSPNSQEVTIGVITSNGIYYLTPRADLVRNAASVYLSYESNGSNNLFRLEQV